MKISLPFLLVICVLSLNSNADDRVKTRSPKEWREDLVASLKKVAEKNNEKFTARDEEKFKPGLKTASEDLEELSTVIPSDQLKKFLLEDQMWVADVKGKAKSTPKSHMASDDALSLITPEMVTQATSKNPNTLIRSPKQLLDFLMFTDSDKECNQTLFDRFKNNFHTQEEKACFFDWAIYRNLQEETYYRTYWKSLMSQVWKGEGAISEKSGFIKSGLAFLMGYSFAGSNLSLGDKLKKFEKKIKQDCEKTRFRSRGTSAVLEGYNSCVSSFGASMRFRHDLGFSFE